MNSKYFILTIILLLVIVGISFISNNSTDINLAEIAKVDAVTVYKSPTCGCCDLYAAYLRKHGVKVVVENTENMDMIKEENKVPKSLYSCHTTVIKDSVVEGHIPIEAVVSMFENDNISNIGMPGMPSSSPGMPGAKRNIFTIYSFENGQATEFMNI